MYISNQFYVHIKNTFYKQKKTDMINLNKNASLIRKKHVYQFHK